MNNTDRIKRLQDKIDESKMKIETIDQDIDRNKQKQSEIKKQLT